MIDDKHPLRKFLIIYSNFRNSIIVEIVPYPIYYRMYLLMVDDLQEVEGNTDYLLDTTKKDFVENQLRPAASVAINFYSYCVLIKVT